MEIRKQLRPVGLVEPDRLEPFDCVYLCRPKGRGEALYVAEEQRNGKTMSCTTCHTADPRQAGKTPAHRKVDPLAPVANPERFTNLKKVEKWFRRNCDDVFARECTAQEKGDFIVWITGLK